MATVNSNAARIPVSLSSSWLATRHIVNLGFSPSPQRCSSVTAYGLHLRICKFNHPSHFTRHLLFTASAAVQNGVSTDTVNNDNQAPSPPNSSFSVHECVSRLRQIVSNVPPNASLNFHKSVSRFRQIVSSLPPPPASMIQRQPGIDFLLGFFAASVCLIIAVKIYLGRRLRYNDPGTVADLVRRGQLRSDRRGISEPMKYDDPFNNPLVKASKGNSTVEMCGKVYNMAPVTLTEEQRSTHQRRRSRAYQWKRPKVFLKEGDAIPPDVDPDTIRWIPANHPFATTTSDIDEGMAQTNVYQKHGVPFRIKAEHEAMQKKLEALQKGEKLGKLYIDSQNAKDFERAFRKQAISNDPMEQTPENDQVGDVERIRSDRSPDSFSSTKDSEHETEI